MRRSKSGGGDLLLHVVDASSDDCERHMRAVRTVLDRSAPARSVLVALTVATRRRRRDEPPRAAPSGAWHVAFSVRGSSDLFEIVVRLVSRPGGQLEFDLSSERERARLARRCDWGICASTR